MAVEAPTLPISYDIDDAKGIPDHVDIAITTNGSKLLSFTLRQLFQKRPVLKLAIDTLQISRDGGYMSIGRDELYRQIKNTNELLDSYFGNNSDAQITLYPEYISFTYAPLVEQKMGVFFGGQIDLGTESNRTLVSLEMSPDEVSVFGLSTAIDSLIHNQELISTEISPLVIDADSVSYHRVALLAPPGIRLTPDSVTIKTEVAPLKYKSFFIDKITVRNLPEGYNIRLFPSSIKVTYLAVDDVNTNDIVNLIHLYVDVDEVTDGTKRLKVRLPFVPKELNVLQLEPDSVEYLIEEE